VNLRQHKRFRTAQQLGWLAYLTALGRQSYDESMASYWVEVERKQAVRTLVEPDPVEAAKIEYVVAKARTGEVVGTFDLREDALALVKKHDRQKKAKLTLVLTDGVEPFTEEEMYS